MLVQILKSRNGQCYYKEIKEDRERLGIKKNSESLFFKNQKLSREISNLKRSENNGEE